jgi:hypothetical protein
MTELGVGMARPLSMPIVAGWMKHTSPWTKKTRPVTARRIRANRMGTLDSVFSGSLRMEALEVYALVIHHDP